VAERSIIRWDVRPAENLLDVLEQADIHLAEQGIRILRWSEYAGELVLTVEPRPGSPAASRQTRVTKPETHR
jgi:hypothetical protein